MAIIRLSFGFTVENDRWLLLLKFIESSLLQLFINFLKSEL